MEAFALANDQEFYLPSNIANREIILIGLDFVKPSVSRNMELSVLLINDRSQILEGFRETKGDVKDLLESLKQFLESRTSLNEKTLVFLSDGSP